VPFMRPPPHLVRAVVILSRALKLSSVCVCALAIVCNSMDVKSQVHEAESWRRGGRSKGATAFGLRPKRVETCTTT